MLASDSPVTHLGPNPNHYPNHKPYWRLTVSTRVCDLPHRLLIDGLLRLGQSKVTLHVKDVPVFVSDVTVPDLEPHLAWLGANGGGAMGARLREASSDGRLAIEAPPFYTSSVPFYEMPESLCTRLGACPAPSGPARSPARCALPPTRRRRALLRRGGARDHQGRRQLPPHARRLALALRHAL